MKQGALIFDEQADRYDIRGLPDHHRGIDQGNNQRNYNPASRTTSKEAAHRRPNQGH